jgi:hypothetical protein
MTYCTCCGKECEAITVNYGPQSPEDTAAYRDCYGEASDCCEGEIVSSPPPGPEYDSAINNQYPSEDEQ